ncbi:MAG: hypothetical protein J6D00_03640, partial [Christensenellaceae bacterium]|nr:hypothetical protein [Christensenellaceae bacterium]
TVLKKYMDNPRVVAVLKSIRPAVVGLILSTAVTMGMSTLLGSKTLSQPFTIEPMSFVIFGIVIALSFGYKKWKKETAFSADSDLYFGGSGYRFLYVNNKLPVFDGQFLLFVLCFLKKGGKH